MRLGWAVEVRNLAVTLQWSDIGSLTVMVSINSGRFVARRSSVLDVWPSGQKMKNYSSFNFLPENLEKFGLTELYGAALEGSTIFLCRSSLGCTSMESCQLVDLKYAIFSTVGCKTKKLPRSKLFLSMVFKHGLLEGLTSEQMWSTVFPWRWERTLAKFGLPFEKATPLEHFPKALKRPRNTGGPASFYLLIFRWPTASLSSSIYIYIYIYISEGRRGSV